MKNVMLLLTMLAVVNGNGVAHAEEINRVAEIVVEETEEIKAVKERKESAVSKTVITRKEMEELGGQTAADVLRRLPRTFFSGPPSTNKDIRMGGLDKEFQNILINGNRPPGGGEKREFALDRIPVEQIERIEVLKNPTAAYDSDAIAGLVDIILKTPPKQQEFSISAGTNQNDRANELGSKFAVSYGDQSGMLGYSLNGNRNDEYRSKLKTKIDPTKNENEDETELNRTITTAFAPTLSLQLGKDDKLTFKPFFTNSVEIKDKEKLVTNLTTGANKNLTLEHERKEQFLQGYALDWNHRLSGGSSLKLLGAYNRNTEDKDKTALAFTGAALAFNKTTFETEYKIDEEFVGGADYKLPLSGWLDTDHVVMLGAKLRHKDRQVEKLTYEVNSSNVIKVITTPDDSYDVKETIAALYLMDEASLTEKLTITPGLRMELTDGSYETSGGRSADGTYVDWNPSMHLRYSLTKDLLLRGSLARTIGRPEFKALVPTRSVKADKVEVGNPDLKTATSYNYEAGVEYYLPNGALVALGGFYKDIANVVEKQTIGIDDATGLPLVKPVNVSEAAVYGAEVELKSDLAMIGMKDLSLNATYGLLDSEVRDATTGIKRRMIDQPQYVASVVLRYDRKSLGLAASVGLTQIGRKENGSEAKIEKSYSQYDLSVTQKLFNGLSLYASVINLTNSFKDVVFQNGKVEKEEVGRTWYAGLRYDL
ncbi:MAG: TonB-dependent receptor plug domain-containing protein [Desulfuromonadaceae bacterium]